MEEKVGNREPHKPEETHNLSEVSQILVKSFHIRRLQKQPFLPLLPPLPIPHAISSNSSQVIFQKSRNSADGHISQRYFEHGPPVKIHEMTAKELKFGYYNMSTEDAEGTSYQTSEYLRTCHVLVFRIFFVL